MKPQLLKVTNGPAHSFSVRQDIYPYINNLWHYHPEVELIHIRKGSGTQFIGDSIKRFNEGDVVLLGAHLPHYWRYDDIFFEQESETHADAAVVHFLENFWGDQFLSLPEGKQIKSLLEKAKRGIHIPAETAKTVTTLIEKLLHAEGIQRVIILMELLSEPVTILSSYLPSVSGMIITIWRTNASMPFTSTRLLTSVIRYN